MTYASLQAPCFIYRGLPCYDAADIRRVDRELNGLESSFATVRLDITRERPWYRYPDGSLNPAICD